MDKKYKKIWFIILTGIITMSMLGSYINTVSGQGEISVPLESSLQPYLKDILDKIKGGHTKLGMEITRRMEFYFYISEKIDSLMDIYSEDLIPFIYQKDLFQGNTIKGTPALLRAPVVLGILHLFIRILQPFYVLTILITALYLLFVSGSPSGRAKAKSTLIKLIIGLGVITLALPIMEMLLEISHYIASMLLSIPAAKGISAPINTDMFMASKEFFIKYFLRITFFEIFFGLPFLAMLIILPAGVLMVLAIRYFMIILLTMFFPFTILLYSFFATKNIGKHIIKQTIIWIFVPIIDASVLLVTWIAYNSTFSIPELAPGTLLDVNAFIVFSGFLMLIFAPLIALGIANWIGPLGMISAIFLNPVAMTLAYFEAGDVDGEEPIA